MCGYLTDFLFILPLSLSVSPLPAPLLSLPRSLTVSIISVDHPSFVLHNLANVENIINSSVIWRRCHFEHSNYLPVLVIVIVEIRAFSSFATFFLISIRYEIIFRVALSLFVVVVVAHFRSVFFCACDLHCITFSLYYSPPLYSLLSSDVFDSP